MNQAKEINILRIGPEEKNKEKDIVIEEVPFTILANEQQLVTLLCSPDNLEYLAAGFLLSEGLVRDKSDIKGVSLHREREGYYVSVKLDGSFQIPENFFQKRLVTSGCGKGTSFFDSQDVMNLQPTDSKLQVSQDEIFQLMKELERRSSLFKTTGGAHSAALCDQTAIKVFAEDMGRHNAIDKVFGECLLKDISTEDKIVLTSGRISSEIISKAAKREVPVIVSRAAPTDLAVRLAEKLRITLVGFVRGKRMNVYTGSSRLI
ncbi:formate dehydrogenase accessory sulfurtransferase FdhD [candidate division NPL-UPA2 bacterium]|nr:formate dehydrogenase accessory sulfurtransferase FdhD [candidate division NPL-UPA2 bacterium]